MAIVRQSRAKKFSRPPLEPWQEAYLNYDGQPLPKCQNMGEMLERLPFDRLCQGRRPAFNKPVLATHPKKLWKRYGPELLKQWIKDRPGTRPLPWWQWEAPPMAGKTAFQQNEMARKRAAWPPEKQAEYLKKHDLLSKSELDIQKRQ